MGFLSDFTAGTPILVGNINFKSIFESDITPRFYFTELACGSIRLPTSSPTTSDDGRIGTYLVLPLCA